MNKAAMGRPFAPHLDSGLTQASLESARSHLPQEIQQISTADGSAGDRNDKKGTTSGTGVAADLQADSGSTITKEAAAQDEKRKQDEAGNPYVEIDWNGPDDPEHPRNWSMGKK